MATYNHTGTGGLKLGYRYIVGGYQRVENNAEIYHVQKNPDMRFVVDESFGTSVRNGRRVAVLRPNGGWTTDGQAKWANQDDSYTMVDQLGLWQWIDDPVDSPDYESYIVLATMGNEIGESGVYGNGFLCQMSPFPEFPRRLTLRIHYTMTGTGSHWLSNITLGYDPEGSGNPSVIAQGKSFDNNIGSNSVHTQDFDMRLVNEDLWVDRNHAIGKPLLFSFNTHSEFDVYNNNPVIGLTIFALEIICEGESSYARGDITNLKESEGFAVSTWYRTWRPTSGRQVLVSRQTGLEDGWELAHDYFYTDSQWDSVLSLRFWDRDLATLVSTGGNSGELEIVPKSDWTHVVAQYRPAQNTTTLRPQSDITIPGYVSKFGDSGTYASAVNGSVNDESTSSGIYLAGSYVAVSQVNVFNIGSLDELPSNAVVRIYAAGNAVGAVATGWTLSDANGDVFATWSSAYEDQDDWFILDAGIYEYPLSISSGSYDFSTVRLGWSFSDYETDPDTEDQIALWIYDLEVVVQDLGTTEILVDGVLKHSHKVFSTPHDSNCRLLLGASDGCGGNALHGDLKDVRLYNRPLSEGEAYQIYRHGCELYTPPSFFAQRSPYYDVSIPHIGTGGLEIGGSAIEFKSLAGDGGLVIGGEVIPTGSSIIPISGGVVVGGTAEVTADWMETGMGGVTVGPYPFLYRKTITVPAETVSEDFDQFYLGVIVELDSAKVGDANFVFADSGLTRLPHEVREYDTTTGRLTAYVRTPLKSDQDNILYVFYGVA